jgi:uncharacterized protein (DUF433 family)
VMVPADRAARIAGISRRRLRYWEKTGIARPSYHRRLSPRVSITLYDLQALRDLLVAVELRRRDISLQHIRQVISRLHERGYQVSQLLYAVVGDEIFFQEAEGAEWEGSRRPFQPLIPKVLDLEPIELKVRRASESRRRSDDAGRIEKLRKVLSSQPVFAGTRIPVRAVWEFLDYGRTAEEIRRAYPRLTDEDVAKAKTLRTAALALKQGENEEAIRVRYNLDETEMRSIRQLARAA